MSTIDRFEDLEAWKLAREFTSLVYAISGTGKFGHDFALRDQIRRASISIVSNIAEGFERAGDRSFFNSFQWLKAPAEKLERSCLALDQKYISEADFQNLTAKAIRLGRVISGLIRYLRQSQFSGKKYKTASA